MLAKFLTIIAILFGHPVMADQYETKANCIQADAQLRKVRAFVSKQERKKFFTQFLSEIANVKLALLQKTTNSPRNYLMKCLQKKRIAFEANLENSSVAFQKNSETLKQLAKFYQEDGNAKLALFYYKEALEKEPRNNDLKIAHFDLMFVTQVRKIKAQPPGPLKEQLKADMEKNFKIILNPLLEDPKVSKKHKIAALTAKAGFYRYGGRMERAVEFYEKLNKLDPTNSLALETLIQYYSSRDRDDRLTPLFKQYFRLRPDNLKASMEYAYFEIRSGRFNQAAFISNQALKHHPRNADVLAMRGLALSLAGRKDEGASYIKNAMKIDPKASWLAIASAHIEYEKGRSFQKRSLPSNALKHFQNASKNLETQKDRKDATKLRNEINTQQAIIIFEFLKDNKFPKTSAARKDASKIVEILTPLIVSDEKAKQSRLLIGMYFKSLSHSALANKQGYCDKLTKAGVLIPQSAEASRICL